jgi:hypothetical protein
MRNDFKITLATSVLLGAGFAAMAAAPAQAMTDAQCATTLKQADKNGDGALTQDEAPSYFAAARVGGKTVGDQMSSSDFVGLCKAGFFDAKQNSPGAPMKGANSFTESQAKDRAVARGFTNISALSKDKDGIWRGTAQHDGKNVQIAIDYKGDVVAQ